MRLGLMVGPERGRYATKVERMTADATWAETAGFSSVWIPQIPDEFDALTAATVVGMGTSRIEIGTAVVPVQPRHPIALAQQALSVQAVCGGRLTLGLGVSHDWIIEQMLGLPYERPAATMRDYLDVLDRGARRPRAGRRRERAVPDPQPARHHRSRPDPGAAGGARPGDAQDGGGARRAARSSGWPTSGPSPSTSCRTSPAVPRRSGGRPPVSSPGSPCACARDDEIDAAVARANRILSEADVSPNYQRLLDLGNAQNVGDILAAGSEETVEKRLRSFFDAGTTDISVRVVPIGSGRDELIASSKRTRAFLASLAAAG